MSPGIIIIRAGHGSFYIIFSFLLPVTKEPLFSGSKTNMTIKYFDEGLLARSFCPSHLGGNAKYNVKSAGEVKDYFLFREPIQ
jgi:hypothetical protein